MPSGMSQWNDNLAGLSPTLWQSGWLCLAVWSLFIAVDCVLTLLGVVLVFTVNTPTPSLTPPSPDQCLVAPEYTLLQGCLVAEPPISTTSQTTHTRQAQVTSVRSPNTGHNPYLLGPLNCLMSLWHGAASRSAMFSVLDVLGKVVSTRCRLCG